MRQGQENWEQRRIFCTTTFPACWVREDSRIESFFTGLDCVFLGRSFAYTNNQGKTASNRRTWLAAICSTISRIYPEQAMRCWVRRRWHLDLSR